MQDVDVRALATQVLWAAFGLAVVLGAIMQRTRFCTMGAVADIVSMGDWARVRIGSGNLKSAVVFIVLGIAAFATLKGITAVARVATVDRAALNVPAGTDLPSIVAAATGASKAQLAALLGLAIGGSLVAWALW